MLAERRNDLMSYLKTHSIGSRLIYPPINTQRAYRYKGTFPVSELVGQRGLWLPSASQLTDAQVHRVCRAITEFYDGIMT